MKRCCYNMMLCASAAFASSTPSYAQDTRQAAPQSAFDNAVSTAPTDEILVTARRREENLADVPVAVEVFGGQALNERGILTEADLQSATAGLTVRQTGSSNQSNFSLRGQSIDAFSFASPVRRWPYGADKPF